LAYAKLALVRLEMGEREKAVVDYEQARATFARLAEEFPTIREHRVNLAVSHYHLGILLSDLGKLAEAAEAYRAALPIFERLATDFSTNTGYRRELSAIPDGLGEVLRALGKWAEAEAVYRQSLNTRKKLAADFPAVPIFRRPFPIPGHPASASQTPRKRALPSPASPYAMHGNRPFSAWDSPPPW
jgi:tetratricopeptide (TPR) repeat protein